MYASRFVVLMLSLLMPSLALSISHGTWSSEDHTFRINGGSSACSAVLITPVWALTAGHCVTPSYQAMEAVPSGGMDHKSIKAKFGQDPENKTWGTSISDVYPYKSPLDFNTAPGYGDSHLDVALIKLSERVPSWVASPILPPVNGVAGCSQSSTFHGKIVGYGNDTLINPDPSFRRESSSNDWEWEAHGTFGIYWNRWLILPGDIAGLTYYGALPGDSGGPLIDDSGHLCGVASRYLPWGTLEFVIPTLHWYSEYASVDSYSMKNWIESKVVLPNSTFEGRCENNLNDNQDSDGDFTPDACDNCPNEPNNQADSDGDGVGDACDRCPGFDDSVDSDKDGWPDLGGCDPCIGDIGDLSDPDGWGDSDRDGICNTPDNCPYTKNADQANANEFSETVHSPNAIWGDVCEPVPQPYTELMPNQTYVGGIDSGIFTQKVYHVKQDDLLIQPLASHHAPSALQSSSTIALKGVPTQFRFCQPTAGIDCVDPTVVNDGELHLELQDASFETASMPYHRITLDNSGPRGSSVSLDYDDLSLVHKRWDFQADQQFWSDSGILPVAPPQVGSGPFDQGLVISPLHGTLWLHAESGVGGAAPLATGYHGEQLANIYLGIRPSYLRSSTYVYPVQSKYPEFIWWTLPDPPYELDDLTNVGANIIVETETGFGSLANDGGVSLVEDMVSGDLAASWRNSRDIWTPSSDRHQSGNSQKALSVAIDPETLSVSDAAFLNSEGSGLHSALEAGWNMRAFSSFQPAEYAPTSLTTAYSQYFDAAWVVGKRMSATDPFTGAAQSETFLLRIGVEDPYRVELPTSLQLGTPLAAAVSFRDGGLYVLDELRGVQVRLLRFDAMRGGGEILSQWQRTEPDATLRLQLDAEGNLLLSSSSAAGTRVAKIEIDFADYAVKGYQEWPNHLAAPVVVGRTGLGMIFEQSGEGQSTRPGVGAASAALLDTDSDSVTDSVDNCLEVRNPEQIDTDGDGYGNACDGDFQNDGVVDGTDFTSIFLNAFMTGIDNGLGTDMNADGVVDGADFMGFFLEQFGRGSPGPSGHPCAGTTNTCDNSVGAVFVETVTQIEGSEASLTDLQSMF